MGNLGEVTDQRSAWAQKKFLKKSKQNSFFQFLLKIEIGI